ncbi:MAG TPA: malto-oligosyltrehalose trehalohydrolase [Longimicrobiales bacterium]|nr:malto-oligosyltrehalose trehalohydrolase [Longimicrobiales bacterium]
MTEAPAFRPTLGAVPLGGGRCRFGVWAPAARAVTLHLHGPADRLLPMARADRGYFEAEVDDAPPGTAYTYRLDDGGDLPDPASRFQPRGVHAPSAVADPAFPWTDAGYAAPRLADYVIYELHVGAFTPEGTFEAVIPHLDRLRDLGVTAIELMPVAQFPGERNWGYDGVFPFAPQSSYGGPHGLRRLVDAAHALGLGVILDVVYNHVGPEGNYFGRFGPYFNPAYRTPWGGAINFDGPGSDEVRRYYTENALYWAEEFHVDALRLDAVHAIVDLSARPFLKELGEAVHRLAAGLGRHVYLIAESDLNDPRLVTDVAAGGYGLDAQWADDFHHALHALLTGERGGYYQDYGSVEDLARAFRTGYVYSGQYSRFRDRRHGASPEAIPAHRFVVFAQNHDQIGNRVYAERLSSLVPFEGLKLAAAAVVLSPFIPLLFMGEEYGETAPFLYFVSHTDPDLVEAVRAGRKAEFAAFGWGAEPPDPQAEATFRQARLRHDRLSDEQHRALHEFHRELLRLRRSLPALARGEKDALEAVALERERALIVRRWAGGDDVALLFSFSEAPVEVSAPLPPGDWCRVLDSADARWGGTGGAHPARLVSDGRLAVTLAPRSALALERRDRA